MSPLRSFFYLHKFKILHFYAASPLIAVLVLAARVYKVKTVFTLHGDFYAENKNKNVIKRLFWIPVHLICIKLVDRVTFPSKYLSRSVLKHVKVDSAKYSVIYNGVEVIKQSKRLGNSLLSVTNFNLAEKAQGVDLLIKVYKKSKITEPLNIVGGGRLLEFYKERYESDNIKFLGYREDVLPLIAHCKAFVYYSTLDNLPYVVLEALALEKEVIANKVGGLPEILPETSFQKDTIKLTGKKTQPLIDITAKRMSNNFKSLYENI